MANQKAALALRKKKTIPKKRAPRGLAVPMSTPAERKALSRKRRAGAEPASESQRIQGASYETRSAPLKSGNTYEHELTPAGAPLSPKARKRLQTRRSSRIASVRERSAREKLASCATASASLPQERHLVPGERKRDGWVAGELIYFEGKFGQITEHVGGRYLKAQLDDGSSIADCLSDEVDYVCMSKYEMCASCESAESFIDGRLDARRAFVYGAHESNSPPPLLTPLRLVYQTMVEADGWCCPTCVAPLSKFTQVWRLRNISYSRPIENCRLVNVGGLQGGPSGGVQIATVAPRALFDVEVEFQAPAESDSTACSP